MKEYLGYGRSRNKEGDVEAYFFNEYVNCIHTSVGHSRMNMQVLVAEFDMSEIKYIGQMSSSQNSRVIDPEGISYAVTNGEKDGEPKIIERDTPMKGNYTEPRICTMVGRDPNNPKSRKKADGYVQMLEIGDDVSNTLTSVQKDNLVAEPNENGEPLRIPQATKKGFIEVMPGSLFDMSYPESKTRRGRVQEGGKVSPTLMASGEAPCLFEGVSVHPNSHALEFKGEKSIKTDASQALRATDYKAPHCVWENSANYRIRKLTPKECFRLMGVSERDIEKIQNSGVSQSQQYKMAGNSIVVDVLEHIFRKMFVEPEQESKQLSLF